MTRSFLRIITLISVALTVVACGGGSGGTSFVGAPPPTSPPPPPPPSSTFQPGVFMAATAFQNRCEVPRTGTDPTNNNLPFPDIAGSTLDENNFLRSFTNDTYLWYDEITDQDPANFATPQAYFEELRTFETTPSGTPKDQFSFSFDSEEWFNLSQGGVSGGYGATFSITVVSATPPREIVVVVAYTEPNSPATTAGIARGATILTVDGVDINDGSSAAVNTINGGLFPDGIGETHTFEILDAGAANSRMVTLTSATITEAPVQNTRVIDTAAGQRVGYFTYNGFTSPSEGELIDAIDVLNQGGGVDDLVLDLRYNGGGFGFIAGELAYMIAGNANTNGKDFDLLEFNDKYPATNPITGQALVPDQVPTQTLGIFSEPANVALPSLNLSRVFILTGPGTCSASELVINGLRGMDVEVILIGSTTCGKPYGFYEERNCGTSYFPIQFRGVNAKGFGDYTDGFVPSAVDDDQANVLGCMVADDFTQQLGDANENRLEVALAYQAGLGCTTPVTASPPGVVGKTSLPLDAIDGVIRRSPFASNLILTRP